MIKIEKRKIIYRSGINVAMSLSKSDMIRDKVNIIIS
jgi:hypothetical protein